MLFFKYEIKKRDFRKQKKPQNDKIRRKKNLYSSKSKVVDVATTLLDALAGNRTRVSRTVGERSTTELQVLLPAIRYRFIVLKRSTTELQVLLPAIRYRFIVLNDMLSDYVNGNKRKTCFRNVTLYFRERLSLITSTEI